MVNLVSAQDIKRRGLSIVEEQIEKGPIHLVKNNRSCYVIITEERYQELLEVEELSYIHRIQSSLHDIQEGRVQTFKDVDSLLEAIDRED